MCGRFVQASPFSIVAETFDIEEGRADLPPRYNIAPEQKVWAVIREAGSPGNRLVLFRWGLVPSWSKDPSIGGRMINARAESVAEKPSFKNAFRNRRCLVVADGFYEWRRTEGTKTPFYIRLASGRPFGLAGLYETWASPAGEVLRTCTIITTRANDLLTPVHDRMPVIVPEDRHALWLDPDIRDPKRLLPLLQPHPSSGMAIHEVSRLVHSPGNDSPDLIEPLPGVR